MAKTNKDDTVHHTSPRRRGDHSKPASRCTDPEHVDRAAEDSLLDDFDQIDPAEAAILGELDTPPVSPKRIRKPSEKAKAAQEDADVAGGVTEGTPARKGRARKSDTSATQEGKHRPAHAHPASLVKVKAKPETLVVADVPCSSAPAVDQNDSRPGTPTAGVSYAQSLSSRSPSPNSKLLAVLGMDGSSSATVSADAIDTDGLPIVKDESDEDMDIPLAAGLKRPRASDASARDTAVGTSIARPSKKAKSAAATVSPPKKSGSVAPALPSHLPRSSLVPALPSKKPLVANRSAVRTVPGSEVIEVSSGSDSPPPSAPSRRDRKKKIAARSSSPPPPPKKTASSGKHSKTEVSAEPHPARSRLRTRDEVHPKPEPNDTSIPWDVTPPPNDRSTKPRHRSHRSPSVLSTDNHDASSQEDKSDTSILSTPDRRRIRKDKGKHRRRSPSLRNRDRSISSTPDRRRGRKDKGKRRRSPSPSDRSASGESDVNGSVSDRSDQAASDQDNDSDSSSSSSGSNSSSSSVDSDFVSEGKDPWLKSYYGRAPTHSDVVLHPIFPSSDAPKDEFAEYPSTWNSILKRSPKTAHLSRRLRSLLVTPQDSVFINPAFADPKNVVANTDTKGSVYFNISTKYLKPPRNGGLPYTACFLMLGTCVLSQLNTVAERSYVKDGHRTDVRDHRIGIRPFEWFYQRSLSFLGTVSGKPTIRYPFSHGIIQFTTRVERTGESEPTSNFTASPRKYKLPPAVAAHAKKASTSGTPSSTDPSMAPFNTLRFSSLAFESKVPVFDGRAANFVFGEFSIKNLSKLPRYKHSEVPLDALVMVGYTANTYVTRASPAETLSLNLQFVVLLHPGV